MELPPGGSRADWTASQEVRCAAPAANGRNGPQAAAAIAAIPAAFSPGQLNNIHTALPIALRRVRTSRQNFCSSCAFGSPRVGPKQTCSVARSHLKLDATVEFRLVCDVVRQITVEHRVRRDLGWNSCGSQFFENDLAQFMVEPANLIFPTAWVSVQPCKLMRRREFFTNSVAIGSS